jgi:hypothetical protein|tara:strand:- start:303 stop:488 length:186 start_codon:yes stop_codon:yes gene_type:complete
MKFDQTFDITIPSMLLGLVLMFTALILFVGHMIPAFLCILLGVAGLTIFFTPLMAHMGLNY